jgi:geranylgeranyl diphosphate synthase type II
MMDFKTYVTEKKALIDQRLGELLHTDVPQFTKLYDAMNYSLLAGGKRIRPILMLATLEALGKDTAPYVDVACALECIHSYSLIHDDLPAMDDDALRRGKPTNHVVYGEGMAILAGDGLLTFAFELMARQPLDPAKLAQCIAVFAKAAGPAGMVGGQAFDLLSEGNEAIGIDGLKLLHRMKTGIIFQGAIDLAAILGDAAPTQRALLETYARQMGLTFQITDDILDFTGDEAVLGKPVGSDAKNHKATYVTIFSLDEAKRMAREAASAAIAATAPLGDKAWFLRDLVSYLLVRAN